MKTKRASRTIVDERIEFELLGNSYCMWTDLSPRKIQPTPLKLQDGRTIQPGDRVTRLGGKKTSAGWTTIHMLPGEYLTYLGQYSNLEGTLVLFQTREPKADYTVAFWLHDSCGEILLFHFTPANSGRQVETTHCEFTSSTAPEGPCQLPMTTH